VRSLFSAGRQKEKISSSFSDHLDGHTRRTRIFLSKPSYGRAFLFDRGAEEGGPILATFPPVSREHFFFLGEVSPELGKV